MLKTIRYNNLYLIVKIGLYLNSVNGNRLFLQFLSMKLHAALIGPFQDHSISDRCKLLALITFSEKSFKT